MKKHKKEKYINTLNARKIKKTARPYIMKKEKVKPKGGGGKTVKIMRKIDYR